MTQEVQAAARGRRQLMMIIALFLVPPIAAWIAWQYLGEHGVSATTNAGTLISPARPLGFEQLAQARSGVDATELRGRWLYVVYAQHGCDARCEKQLYLTRQVRIAVNKDTPRVKRLLVLGGGDTAQRAQIAEQHPDLLVVEGVSEQLSANFNGSGFASAGEQFFLVDPLGNLMMFYDAEISPKGILRDLQKLLKISQVG